MLADNAGMKTQLDHLVILAASLEEGVRWCEQTLGVIPGPGGSHPLMGTHNRLVRIGSTDFPDAYLEIIAVEPGVKPQRGVHQRRWFELDDPTLSDQIRRSGPQLAHWVARTGTLPPLVQAWHTLGIDRGEILAASRMTPTGLLEWKITVRDDGARLFDGCLPTLIEWGARHPAHAMADSGVVLEHFQIRHPEAAQLESAWQSAGLTGVPVAVGKPELIATLATPRGRLQLTSTPSPDSESATRVQ